MSRYTIHNTQIKLIDKRLIVGVLLSLIFIISLLFFDFVYSLVFLLVIIGTLTLIITFQRINYGVVILISIAFFLQEIKRNAGMAPLGIILDGYTVLLLILIFIHKLIEAKQTYKVNMIEIMITLWIIYNLLELFNPSTTSQLAWFYTVRNIALTCLVFFIAGYALKTEKDIKLILSIWIILSLCAALYGLSQEFLGFSNKDMVWILEDARRHQLLFQGGKFRIFSFFSGPMDFGITMAYTGVFCLIVSQGTKKMIIKLLLISAGTIMLFSMIFSGTRTAYMIVPFGLLIYIIGDFKWRFLIPVTLLIIPLAIIVIMPTQNPSLYRLKTAFRPTQDASFMLRLENQSKIQPFIRHHLIGIGLGSTGTSGMRFSPDSKLAGFPTDSGYVRIALEQGVIGLMMYLLLIGSILFEGCKKIARISDRKRLILLIGMLAVIFMLSIANYTQDVLTSLPTNILFFVFAAIVVKMDRL